jgi:hypothetical protein
VRGWTLHRGRRVLVAVLLYAGVCLTVAATGMPSAGATGSPGLLRVAHLSPDTPAVDIAVVPLPAADGTAVDPGPDLDADLRYGDVSAFTELAAGSYAVSIRAAGAGPAAPPALSTRVEVLPAGAWTVVITGRFADLDLHVLADDLSSPPPDSARVRVLAAAGGAETIDVSMTDGPALTTGLPFGGADSPVVVPAGRAVLRVDGAPAELAVQLAAGSVVTLLVLDSPDGGLTLQLVLDAAGPALVPSGGVDAGSGGTVGAGPLETLAGIAAGAGAALAWRGRGRAVAVAVNLAAVHLAAVTLAGMGAPGGGTGPPPAAVPAHGVALPASATRTSPVAPVAPVRLTLPTAGIDTALTGVALDASGSLGAPPDTAGWYRQGPLPGAPGPAVVTGHVDGPDGPAVFFRLAGVAVGDPVLIERADGTTVRFTVTRVARHPKDAFPAEAVYGPTPDAQLRLITCGGEFDRASGSYRDNVVVHARLT